MAINLTYPVVYTPEVALTYSYRQRLPLRIVCPTLPPPFIFNEGDSWNCNLCGADKPFFIPFLRGDIFPLQTVFPDNFNTNPSVIASGFKDSLAADWYVMVELQDESGTTISSFIDTFCSEYNVSYTPEFGSVQTWFVNTGLLPLSLNCFRFKITYYFYNQVTALKEVERVIYTEYFRKIEDCERYSAISSTYDTIDCYGNLYTEPQNYLGTSNTAYYNFLRLEGEVEYTGSSVNNEVETDRGIVLRKQIIEDYQLRGGIVAPYFARMIDRAVLGKTVLVDGVQYENFSFSKNNDLSREWVIFLNFQKLPCTIDTRNCTL